VGKRQKFVEVLVGQPQHLQRLILVEAFAAIQYLVACLRQNVAHRWVLLVEIEHVGGPTLEHRSG
jgi:hypothetical protein